MKFRFLMSAMLATAFCATPTWAAGNGSAHRQGAVPNARQGAAPDSRQGVAPDSPTAKPSAYSITLTMIESPSSTSGPCTGGEGWADYCPSGECDCYTYSGTASGTAGKGPVMFYQTYDWGSEVDTYNTYCGSAYGEIDIAGSKDTEAIVFTGGDCGTIAPPSFAAPFLNGGCILGDTAVFTLGGAVAQCGGNYSDVTNTKFTIKGKALK